MLPPSVDDDPPIIAEQVIEIPQGDHCDAMRARSKRMMLVDAEASHYIATRWSERQREFGRLYWMYLTHKRPRPPYTLCFGAERIATKLERIWRDYWHPELEE